MADLCQLCWGGISIVLDLSTVEGRSTAVGRGEGGVMASMVGLPDMKVGHVKVSSSEVGQDLAFLPLN